MINRTQPFGWTTGVDVLRAADLNNIDENLADCTDAGDINGDLLLQGGLTIGTGEINIGTVTYQVPLSSIRGYDIGTDWAEVGDGSFIQNTVNTANTQAFFTLSFALPHGATWTGVRIHARGAAGHSDPITSGTVGWLSLHSAGYTELDGTSTTVQTIVGDTHTDRATYQVKHSFDVTFGSPVTSWDAGTQMAWVKINGEYNPGVAGLIVYGVEAILEVDSIARQA